MKLSEIALSTTSLTIWSGLAAGLGAHLLAGRSIFNITPIVAQTSFIKAALVGGGMLGSAFGLFLMGVFTHNLCTSSAPDSFDRFLRHWSWISAIPFIAIPYVAKVDIITTISLIGLGILGGIAKLSTVGL